MHFPGGKAIVQPGNNGTQRVIVEDVNGQVLSDSFCEESAGRYDQIVRFGTAVKDAAQKGDKAALAGLMQYPLRVNLTGAGAPKSLLLTSKAELLNSYAQVVSPLVLAELRKLEPRNVFCRDGMAMFGSGVLWESVDRSGQLRGAVINR